MTPEAAEHAEVCMEVLQSEQHEVKQWRDTMGRAESTERKLEALNDELCDGVSPERAKEVRNQAKTLAIVVNTMSLQTQLALKNAESFDVLSGVLGSPTFDDARVAANLTVGELDKLQPLRNAHFAAMHTTLGRCRWLSVQIRDL